MKQKQTIRLNESQLNRIIKESVYSVIREGVDDDIDSSLQQCWELLMTAYNQAVNKTVSEYGWGDSKLPEKYKFTMKILGEINELIYAFDRAYQADYYQQKWDRETHEQD